MSGLSVILDGIRKPLVDIVSIPGLPNLLPQHEAKEHSRWLRDTLGHQIPAARVMTFQYEFARPAAPTTVSALCQEYLALLYTLLSKRESAEEAQRPLIFICYTFGAYILKQALLEAKRDAKFRPIIENTAGVFFLGCLHEDRPDNIFREACLRCAAVEFRTLGKKHAAIESLRTAEDWNFLRSVMRSFREMVVSFPVQSFFETQRTLYHTGRLMSDKTEILCTRGLSTLGWADREEVIGVDMNHLELCTYPSRSHPFFDVFMSNLVQLVGNCCPPDIIASRYTDDGFVEVETNRPIMTNNVTSLDIDRPRRQVRQDPAAVQAPCFFVEPHTSNDNFVGREDILAKMRGILMPNDDARPREQRTYALCGLGGMGKTQIAIHYAFTQRDTFWVVLWADCDSREKLTECYNRFSIRLGLRTEADPVQDAKGLVKEWLEKTQKTWLLILDNADGPDKDALFRDFIPNCDQGSVLITSRDRNLILKFGGVEVHPLQETSAVDLLKRLSRFDPDKVPSDHHPEDTAALNLVKRIGCLPLGITQAANLINSDSCSITEFLGAYSNQELIQDSEHLEISNSRQPSYTHSLSTVWNMNFDRLNGDEKRLMNVIAFCDPDRFQLDLFEKVVTTLASEPDNADCKFLSTPRKIHKCKTGLVRSSLVWQNEFLRELSLHRLVQASCHTRMTFAERQSVFSLTVKLVRRAFPVPERNAIHNPALWGMQQRILPHAESLCHYYVESLMNEKPLIPDDQVNWGFATLLYEVGWFCYESGQYRPVEKFLKPAEAYSLLHLNEGGGGDTLLADIYGGLGSLASETNQPQACYDYFHKQWECLQNSIKNGGIKQPDIREVFGLGRLGNANSAVHRFAEAEKYYEKMFKAWEGLGGDQKFWRCHHASSLWLQGKLDEAEKRVRDIVIDRDGVLNSKQATGTTFRTGTVLYTLGNVLMSQGLSLINQNRAREAEDRFTEASEAHAHCMLLWELSFGKRHHKMGDATYKAAWHAHRRREYDTARTLLHSVIDIFTQEPEYLRNELARAKYKLGCVLQDMGELESGRLEITEAENLRKLIVPQEKWLPATGEEAYDELIMFWSR
ncbi:tetratricopeptide repeat domain-containing protein [Phlyctema vagabunda]|uniref:Tetratricopeptide repeat domain-containing protein n=1 Tax=Phlyctema vagabunda TaxID=108571 RepID=A0ABR4P716_9HELO